MQSEYPLASFVQAHPSNYRKGQPGRRITNIVPHCTDGHGAAKGTAEMFAQRNERAASAHFVVGQAGEVIQCVRLDDIALHAHDANAFSIGIEHCARTPKELGPNDPGLPPTEAQYLASAQLVAWLCDSLGLPRDRNTIQGHAEIDKKTTHTKCPTGCGWDWDHYIELVVAVDVPQLMAAA